jgi:hypothetical protein
MANGNGSAVFSTSDPIFVIPTYRLRDVAETVEAYDDNFSRNGHSIKIMVFDDSSIATHKKYFSKLEQTRTTNPIYYVGPNEKRKFTNILLNRLQNTNMESIVNGLFRPSYGGNRNFTLLYTLGTLMISSDDDMRPEALIHNSNTSLQENEICHGILAPIKESKDYTVRSFDIINAFMEVLGKPVKLAPTNYTTAEYLIDSAMDLETNTSKGLSDENSLLAKAGYVRRNAVVKVAQTFRTGTNDMDALDFADLFLKNPDQISPDDLNQQYMIVNFRPIITSQNWRMDCGVAGYDNNIGLPPFFPTKLRFEDYVYRLWLQKGTVASAHVNAVQRHIKNNYMRSPLAADILNEEISNFLKKKIKDSMTSISDLGIRFEYDGSISSAESNEVLEKIAGLHTKLMSAAQSHDETPERRIALASFGNHLEKIFYGFEPDFFQQNVSRMIDDEIDIIKSSLEIWPTLVDIIYRYKDIKELPQLKVNNTRKAAL